MNASDFFGKILREKIPFFFRLSLYKFSDSW